MKGDVQPNHVPKNKGRLIVAGMPTITCTTIGDLTDETDSADMPDRTTVSGGQSKPTTFDITIPAHHDSQIAALDRWVVQGRDPVSPMYKKVGTYVMERLGYGPPKTYMLRGLWAKSRMIPGSDMSNEGELQQMTYTMSVDEIRPVS